MTKTWEIKLADGRLIRKTGEKLGIDESGTLMVIDNTAGGLVYAVSPGAWDDCTAVEVSPRRARS